MGRPPAKLDTPELKNVAQKKKALDKAEAERDRRRAEYDDAVVAALRDNGYPTIAKVAEVTTKAIQNVAAKRGVTSPRA